MKIQMPTLGRVVLVTFRRKNGETRQRAARVVNAWPNSTTINATVDLDGSNDSDLVIPEHDRIDARTAAVWSCPHSGEGIVPDGAICSWRYPPRSDELIDVEA